MDLQPSHLSIRQRQKAETRDRVLTAGRKLFEAHGYSAVTVRMLSEEANVAVGSVFTAFDSKDDLLVEIVCEDYAQFIPIILAGLHEYAERPLAERIVAAFAPAIEYDVRHIRKLRDAVANSWTRTSDQEVRTRRAIMPLIVAYRDLFAAAKQQGQIWAEADPAVLADTILHLYYINYRRAAFDNWDEAKISAAFLAQLRHLLH